MEKTGLITTCPDCGKKWFSVGELRFCPYCESTNKKGGAQMAKVKKTFKTPSGGTYTKMVESKTGKKTAKKTSKKSTAASKTGMIHHKAYSYTNKTGKTVHVAAHDERRRK